MPKALAHPKQTSYPLSVTTGHDAAALWLENSVMSPVIWRDYHSSMHVCDVGFNDLIEHRQAFDEAFVRGVADVIIGVVIIVVEVSRA